MPANFKFSMTDSEYPAFDGMETVRCVRCGYEIPVKSEFVDYKILYNSTHRLLIDQSIKFENFCNEISEEVPEVKIYLHNKKAELRNMINELIKKYKNEMENY